MPRPKLVWYMKIPFYVLLEKHTKANILMSVRKTITDITNDVVNLSPYLFDKMFEIGIIQLGLVDCAPRPLAEFGRTVISALPSPLKGLAIIIVHKLRPFIIKMTGIKPKTSLKDYCEYLNILMQHTNRLCKTTIVLTITPVLKKLDEHSPHFTEQINKYNAALESITRTYTNTRIIDLSRLFNNDERLLTNDAHITKAAHRLIWTEIHKLLEVIT